MAGQAVLTQKTTQAIRRFAAQLTRAGIPYTKLLVFGSQVKKSATENSDIDICVVSDRFGSNRFSDRLTLMKIRDKDTYDIEPHPMNPEELTDPWDPLAHEIRTWGVVVI